MLAQPSPLRADVQQPLARPEVGRGERLTKAKRRFGILLGLLDRAQVVERSQPRVRALHDASL